MNHWHKNLVFQLRSATVMQTAEKTHDLTLGVHDRNKFQLEVRVRECN